MTVSNFETSFTGADYVIVGGGSAGCVLAARLSESKDVNVILIEAGGFPRDERFRVPAGFSALLCKEKHDWCYPMKKDPTMNNRQLIFSAGKTLGGGSSINGCVYIRGLANDYNDWDASNGGNSGWSYEDMLPYFQKAESYVGQGENSLGSSGPQIVSDPSDPNPLGDSVLGAAQDLGLPIVDVNSGDAVAGFGDMLTTIHNGRRASTYECYLKPVLKRPNLRVLYKATASRLMLDEDNVSGVEVTVAGKKKVVRARKEVLVAAGAIGTPALLLRSGIGPGRHLSEVGIETKADLPGVGENLQDHTNAGIAKFVDMQTINSQTTPLAGLKQLIKYYAWRKGVLSSAVVEKTGYIKTNPDLDIPDVLVNFVPFGYVLHPDSVSALMAYQPKQNAMMLSAYICKPKTRGTVRLESDNPDQRPIVDYQLLAEQEDVDKLIRALKYIQALYNTPALKSHVTGELSLTSEPNNDGEWAEYLRASCAVAYHFCGTCKMGNDELSVVDSRLKIRKLSGARIVDASVIPRVTSANINSPTIAIAEKAADMIIGG